MLLSRDKEDIKQIPSGSTNHDNFLDYFCGRHSIKPLKRLAQLFQVSIHVHPCHPLQQTTRNGFNA